MYQIIIREERKEDYRATEFMTMRAFWNLHGPGCNEHLLVHKLRTAKEYLPELSRVAEIMGSSHQNVKQILNKLEDKGYVKTVLDEQDKRKQRIILTEKT